MLMCSVRDCVHVSDRLAARTDLQTDWWRMERMHQRTIPANAKVNERPPNKRANDPIGRMDGRTDERMRGQVGVRKIEKKDEERKTKNERKNEPREQPNDQTNIETSYRRSERANGVTKEGINERQNERVNERRTKWTDEQLSKCPPDKKRNRKHCLSSITTWCPCFKCVIWMKVYGF